MDDLATIRNEALSAVEQAADLGALDAVRVAALGKKGSVTGLMKTLGTLAPRAAQGVRRAGQPAQGRDRGGARGAQVEARQRRAAGQARAEKVDVTLPARPEGHGTLHPIGQVMDELAAIFGEMGFTWAEGPDIEDDWHNFTALNIPPDHPARQMQDTFYLPPRADGTPMVLRTHTSPVQARTMLDKGVQKMLADGGSLRVIVPGPHLPHRQRCDPHADVPPGRGAGDRPHHAHGAPQGLPVRFLPRLFRGRRAADPLPARPTSRSPSRRPRSISAARGRTASSGSAPAIRGSRSWAAAWSIRARSPIAASIPRSTRASPSAWASIASPC
jgi:hypothetical protein